MAEVLLATLVGMCLRWPKSSLPPWLAWICDGRRPPCHLGWHVPAMAEDLLATLVGADVRWPRLFSGSARGRPLLERCDRCVKAMVCTRPLWQPRIDPAPTRNQLASLMKIFACWPGATCVQRRQSGSDPATCHGGLDPQSMNAVIPGPCRNPWIPDQVRDDIRFSGPGLTWPGPAQHHTLSPAPAGRAAPGTGTTGSTGRRPARCRCRPAPPIRPGPSTRPLRRTRTRRAGCWRR